MAVTPKNFQQALGALVRGVEQNHQARVNDDGSISVKSDTRPNVTYIVQFWGIGAGGQIMFQCTCPAGIHQRFCKHAARAAQRLERMGLAKHVISPGPRDSNRLDWYVTPKAENIMRELGQNVPAAPQQPADPFEGM